jgi:hypothetical protein
MRKVILVPKYVRALEALAARHGFAVAPLRIEAVCDYHYGLLVDHLVGQWRGTRRQFLALEFAAPGFHVPLKEGPVPMRASSPIRWGSLAVDGKDVIFEPTFGPLPLRIEQRGELEVVHYQHRIAFHGSMPALIAAGIAEARLAPSLTRAWRRGSTEEPFGECRWEMRRQPDGSIVYVEDTPQAVIGRRAVQADVEKRLQACRDAAFEQRRWPGDPPPGPFYLH